MFSKIDVNGPDTHPLYAFLKSAEPGLLGTEAIKWNFTKFLIGGDGKVIKRYAPADQAGGDRARHRGRARRGMSDHALGGTAARSCFSSSVRIAASAWLSAAANASGEASVIGASLRSCCVNTTGWPAACSRVR